MTDDLREDGVEEEEGREGKRCVARKSKVCRICLEDIVAGLKDVTGLPCGDIQKLENSHTNELMDTTIDVFFRVNYSCTIKLYKGLQKHHLSIS